VEGKPQTETGYVYDETLPVVGPAGNTRLASADACRRYVMERNSILAFSYFITAMLVLLCLTLFMFLRKYFSELSSFSSS